MSTPTEPDAELVRAFVAGSEQAFKELVRRHQEALHRFIQRQVGNRAETADLCQKVFLKVFLKAQSFRGESSFRTWLYQIAINQCKNHLRARQRQRLDDVEVENLPDEAPTPDAHHPMQEHLRAAVRMLPARQRETLELRFYEGCTFAEIAEIMGCAIGTAKGNYHLAMTTLRKRIRGQDL